MGINDSGLYKKVNGGSVVIHVPEGHPLLKLANALPWEEVLPYVYLNLVSSTEKGQGRRGRKLQLRTHLGAYFLQMILNRTDRQIEREIRENAVYQLFCGRSVVENWSCPDHTRIEDFRNRLSPEVHRMLANSIAKLACRYGFGEPRVMDVDSTVQEVNAKKPSEVRLLMKMGELGSKVLGELKRETEELGEEIPCDFNLGFLKGQAKKYFLSSYDPMRKAKMLELMKAELMLPLIYVSQYLQVMRLKGKIKELPWGLRKSFEQIKKKFGPLLESVNYFILKKAGQSRRPLSLHLDEVETFVKGKEGRVKIKYGRNYQLGRIGGNFLIVGRSEKARNLDHYSVEEMVREHEENFGIGILQSLSMDRGYFSLSNQAFLEGIDLKEFHLPRPGTMFVPMSEQENRLSNRRSGVEALIGHAKWGGQLGRSRAKTDRGTLISGYGSVLGFNLRQLVRFLCLSGAT